MRPVRSTPSRASQSTGRAVAQPVPNGPRLQDHHADRVRDDVVQLTSNSRTLLGDGDASSGLARPLGIGGADLRGLDLLGPPAHRKPGEPSDCEQERREHQLARVMARIVVDDDRRPGEHDRQTESRLRFVPEVAEEQAAAKPATKALAAKGTRRPSTNESAAATIQTDAGAANGKR